MLRDQKSCYPSLGLNAIQTNSSTKNDMSVKTYQEVGSNEKNSLKNLIGKQIEQAHTFRYYSTSIYYQRSGLSFTLPQPSIRFTNTTWGAKAAHSRSRNASQWSSNPYWLLKHAEIIQFHGTQPIKSTLSNHVIPNWPFEVNS